MLVDASCCLKTGPLQGQANGRTVAVLRFFLPAIKPANSRPAASQSSSASRRSCSEVLVLHTSLVTAQKSYKSSPVRFIDRFPCLIPFCSIEMRLLVLSLLGLLCAAQGYSVNYRSLLQGYAPARGEFAVQQGYLRYQDSTGAERLIPVGYDTFQQKGEREDQLLQLRAWCEQRYNAMRIELERLRAEGKQPPAKILAQYEQLDQLIKSNAFEPVPVPGLTPEVQRARDEHLRIWNEARLQVLQAEAEQAGLSQSAEVRTAQESIQTQSKPLLKLPLPLPQPQPANPIQNKPNPYLPSEPPRPVQETAEVLHAREEHLKRFQEALQAQLTTDRDQPSESSIQQQPQQPQQPLQATVDFIRKIATPTFAPQQVPQPVEETPEVKRAREEHLKQYNEALLQAQSQTPIETPIQSSPQASIQAPIQAPTLAPIQAPTLAPIQAPTQAPIQSPPLPFIQSPPQPLPQAPIQSQPQAPIQSQPQTPIQAQALSEPLPEPLAPLPTAAPKNYQSEPAAPAAILSQTEPIAPLPTATIKSSIPSAFTAGQKAYDKKIHQLQKDKIRAEDKVADIEDRLSYEERERERERFRDLELRRKEQRQAELEQEQEAQRLTEERNLLEAEQLALVLQEQKRLQDDLQQDAQDAQRLQAEQKFSFAIGNKAADPSSSGGSSFKLAPSKPQTPVQATPVQPQAIAQQQQVQNGFFLRIQSGQPAGEGYVLAENTQNPFLLRYVQQPQALALTQPLAQPLALPLGQFKVIPGHSKAKPSPIATSGYIALSAPNGISELEKATREHFKAHEIAREQLRLANLKDISSIPTSCQH